MVKLQQVEDWLVVTEPGALVWRALDTARADLTSSTRLIIKKCRFVRRTVPIECGSIRTARVRVRVSFGNEKSLLYLLLSSYTAKSSKVPSR